MDSLLAARLQMAISLGFHMIFASLAVGMPLLMLIAEGLYLRRRDPRYLELARTWAKVTAITFAIGAVSGTALSFELGLLWPAFMELAGPATGAAFTLEGFAFFTEAIFLGLYLYGWNRLSPRAHWLTGIPVAISSAASSVLVVAANAWMQNPVGVETLLKEPHRFDPVAALFGNPAWPVMAVHSTLACYAATAFMVAAVYAWAALRGHRDPMRRSALRIALAVGTVAALLMPITGDASAKFVARNQPVKLAAMEAQFGTEAGAPLRIGGLPDPETRQVPFAVEIPGMLSWLAYGDTRAVVQGLDRVPRDLWPNVPVTHIAFQVMVIAGVLMVLVSAWYWWAVWRRRGTGQNVLDDGRLMRALVAAGPLGIVALEAGWIVTEVGRQPWIIRGVMRTAETVTPAPGVVTTLVAFTLLYVLLSITLVWLLRRIGHQPVPGVTAPAGSGGGPGAPLAEGAGPARGAGAEDGGARVPAE
ncbi:cytochrome bd quinol oxidase subunit 1 apoprotein [Thermaerobacter marianensis DSM 12885]|uniref:Cytochrome bd quinol oxidase subunit 1 apoprotein n=1 Tax=Thermaerobacter marianensis (strain ATCC 700841 / DSM 12885 / JCM 10246 / 7p75a) TaxID=644966 RepID=E6SI73_THEM7|nr:cytochrome ubiquinol oxidase subunit I [Thermaerobacter marianensis]ADU50851.1 cytochrome bd quinol oxidase subunit 1 apoprotein [Thermaerobacter marianensis DSM 12885]